MATLIRTDRNGTKYFSGMVACDRCGGAGGADKWVFTGWTCYKCGGTGKQAGTWKEYTPEYEAKLQARREARMAKQMAKFEAEQARIMEEQARKEAEEEAKRIAEEEARKAQKAISKHVGQIGDKVDLQVTFDHSAWWTTPNFYGWGVDTMYAHTFRDSEGNAYVWKTSKQIGNIETTKSGDQNFSEFEKGQAIILKGTIKDHSEYDEEKQTILTRCKVQAV